MSKVTPVFSTGRMIQDTRVTFVVDANILIEFAAIDQIDWELLCPRATSARIVVPTTVVGEMDKHKKCTGRLRRRALEFNRLLLKIEDGDGEPAELDHDRMELSLMLMPRYDGHQLPGEKLSFTISDDLIVAEAARFSRDHANAIFLLITYQAHLATAGRRKLGFRRPRNHVSCRLAVDSRSPTSSRGRLRFVSAAQMSLVRNQDLSCG